jgi:hypothetical protein
VDKNHHQENLISIKGLEDNFSGRSLFRSIINPLLRIATVVRVECERQNYYSEITDRTIASIGPNISELETSADGFSIQFNYGIDEDIDVFVQVFSNMWFAYEQPSAIFVCDDSVMTQFPARLSWLQITERLDGFVVFKSVEDDVMWIGKSPTQSFETIILE